MTHIFPKATNIDNVYNYQATEIYVDHTEIIKPIRYRVWEPTNDKASRHH